jgi:hypothetical protein
MKTHKLFEAAGVAVLLVSWFLEWNSAKKVEAEKEQLMSINSQINSVLPQQEAAFDTEISYMKTRIVTNLNVPKLERLRDLESVWSEENFRKAWAEHVLLGDKTLAFWNRVLASSSSNITDESRASLEAAESIFKDINTRFAKGLNDASRKALVNSSMFPNQNYNNSVLFTEAGGYIPELNRLSAQEADYILGRLVEYQFALQKVYTQIKTRIDEKADVRFWLFRVCYVIGSILVIGAFTKDAFHKETPQSGFRNKQRKK